MDPSQFLRAQANLIRLERFTDDVVNQYASDGDSFKLNVDFLCRINGIVCDGLGENKNPGQFRRVEVQIKNTNHKPPAWQNVRDLTSKFCNDFNLQQEKLDLVALAAFALWRVNWIHPFENGNGRTARQLSYMTLCIKSGGLLPGRRTVIVQLKENRQRYEQALRTADAGDHKPIQLMIGEFLKIQLQEAFAT